MPAENLVPEMPGGNRVAEPEKPAPAPTRVIGDDWSTRTTAEAAAANLPHKVLCADGWYVPESANPDNRAALG